jgi:renal tumor antigen
MVLELMGENLYDSIKDRKKAHDEKKVKRYIFQLLKALDHMHKNGMFHRDIKP